MPSIRRSSLVTAAAAAALTLSALAHAAPPRRDRGPKFGARNTGFGIGASVGDPMGLSLKYFITPAHAISGHVAWGPLHNGDGLVELDYHWHSPVVASNDSVDAHIYVGGGIGVGFWANGDGPLTISDRSSNAGAALLIKAPALGLAYHWRKVPVDTAIELAWSPYVVMPSLKHLDASVKVRYYF